MLDKIKKTKVKCNQFTTLEGLAEKTLSFLLENDDFEPFFSFLPLRREMGGGSARFGPLPWICAR